MTNIKKILIAIFIADLFLILFSFFYGGKIWLLNSQAAFIASLLITLSSFHSYKKLVSNKVEQGMVDSDERDELDKIDDPFELFEKDEKVVEEEKDFKEIVKEERTKVKNLKTTFVNLKSSLGGALSPLRLGAYFLLFAAFLYLNRHGMLEIFAFLSGLFIVPFAALLSSFIYRNQ